MVDEDLFIIWMMGAGVLLTLVGIFIFYRFLKGIPNSAFKVAAAASPKVQEKIP